MYLFLFLFLFSISLPALDLSDLYVLLAHTKVGTPQICPAQQEHTRHWPASFMPPYGWAELRRHEEYIWLSARRGRTAAMLLSGGAQIRLARVLWRDNPCQYAWKLSAPAIISHSISFIAITEMMPWLFGGWREKQTTLAGIILGWTLWITAEWIGWNNFAAVMVHGY